MRPALKEKNDCKAEVFRSLTDSTRRKLLDLLREGEKPVMELAVHFKMSLPAVSQHLRQLREAGLVLERRHGRQRIYRLEATPLREVADWLSHFEDFWRTRLVRLRDHLDAAHAKPAGARKESK